MGAKLASLSGVLGATQDQGLSFITSSTFSAAASVSLDNCFTSSYDNYRIMTNFTAFSTSLAVSMRLRAASTDASGTNYYSGASGPLYTSAATSFGSRGNASTSWPLIGSVLSQYHYLDLAIHNPTATSFTSIDGVAADVYNIVAMTVGGAHNSATAYDGFTLTASTGNFTGTVRVYGYRSA